MGWIWRPPVQDAHQWGPQGGVLGSEHGNKLRDTTLPR